MGTKIRISRVSFFPLPFQDGLQNCHPCVRSFLLFINVLFLNLPWLYLSVFIIGGGVGGVGEAEGPLNEIWGRGVSPPRFGPEDIGNAAENWFGKLFRLVIFSQIVSQWSRLAKYYFLGLFEQLYPDFEKPINCCLFCH